MRLHFRLHTVLLPGERKKSIGVKDCSVASLASVNSLRCWWGVACVPLSVIKVKVVHFHFSKSWFSGQNPITLLLHHWWSWSCCQFQTCSVSQSTSKPKLGTWKNTYDTLKNPNTKDKEYRGNNQCNRHHSFFIPRQRSGKSIPCQPWYYVIIYSINQATPSKWKKIDVCTIDHLRVLK